MEDNENAQKSMTRLGLAVEMVRKFIDESRNLPFGEDYFYYHCMVYGDILDGSLLLLGSLYVNIWFIGITINIWLIYVW